MNTRVHATHCCVKHGCKYGDVDCPVVNKIILQDHICEDCKYFEDILTNDKSKFLWKFYWDCGRMGEVEGLFVATEQEIKELIGKKINFGEILGKHSEVFGIVTRNDIETIDLDFETVEKVEKVLGETWSGYNPINYIKYECDNCGEDCEEDEFNKETNMCYYCEKEE